MKMTPKPPTTLFRKGFISLNHFNFELWVEKTNEPTKLNESKVENKEVFKKSTHK